MSKWSEIAKYFEENSHSKIYFESQSSAKALRQIQNIVKSYFPQMIFLLGEPGSGKTFLLNHIANHYKDEKFCLMMENPFLTPLELLKRMLAFVEIDPKDKDVESMRVEATAAYKNRPHIIMLDEAQLSHAPLREFIRILSDSKVFWFLIAMHTKEGESLLKNPHFFSRAHQVIYMGSLDRDEFVPYIKQVLRDSDYLDVVLNIRGFLVSGIQKYSKGNFRNFKKLCYEFFLLLDYAHKNDRINFTKPSPKLLEMAAIKAGLTDLKREAEFDILATTTLKNKNKTSPIFVSVIVALLALAGALGWFFIDKEKNKTVSLKKDSVKATKPMELKKEVKSEQKPLKQVKPLPTPKKSNNPKLTFYPPDLDAELLQKQEEHIAQDDSEIQAVNYDESLQMKPLFLDEKVKRTKPILKLSKAKTKGLKELIKSYSFKPDYDLALKIANIYYGKKDFKNASIWAKKANEIDRQQEIPWIIYAKSQYNLGRKNDAISSLKLFLDYKFSQNAKNLLHKWSKELK